MSTTTEEIHLYWTPGCAGCLQCKELLEREGISYIAHNVSEEPGIFEEMEEQGLPKSVPVVRVGNDWIGAGSETSVEDIADFLGVVYDHDPLAVDELEFRLKRILSINREYLEQISEDILRRKIPDQSRTFSELIYHVCQIADRFLEHESGLYHENWLYYLADGEHVSPETVETAPEWNHQSKTALKTYAISVQERIERWFDGPGRSKEWESAANVYYGEATTHEFLERTTWHAGHHTRQLQDGLESIGEEVNTPISNDLWDGLSLPENLWDKI